MTKVTDDGDTQGVRVTPVAVRCGACCIEWHGVTFGARAGVDAHRHSRDDAAMTTDTAERKPFAALAERKRIAARRAEQRAVELRVEAAAFDLQARMQIERRRAAEQLEGSNHVAAR